MSDLEQLPARPAHPSFGDAVRVWARIGVLSFGGPAGQIALMHRELVDERRWISESRFLHALNFCMLLPGPEAQQLATYIGWLLHGWRGGLMAGLLFVAPGFLVILALSAIYAVWGQTGLLDSAFMGLKAAVLVIVVEALIRVGKRSLKNNVMRAVAVAAFVALFAFAAPFPLVILAAALIGYTGFRFAPDVFSAGGHHAAGADLPAVIDADHPGRPASWRGSLLATLVWTTLWAAPFGLLFAFGLESSVYVDISLFFSKMAVVTFGGAYAVLSYVAQQAVDHYQWLKPGEMLDGLGLAETTPGPLVLVLSFVGFIAGFRGSGALSPLAGGALGATLTTWVTFAPCFLWIFLGAPWIERLRANRALSGAMTAISAAVTGVIFNLALWFATHVVFGRHVAIEAGPFRTSLPDPTSVNLVQLALTMLAAIALFRFRLGVFRTLALLAGAGVLVGQAF
ncbi:chromate efflux transporter [Rhizobium sp. TRM95796]|uniref:chromate efflux transporter n=1 Tax=Rhizobium sp. TRM95796 TaxID=2979862 RepID=UPI0021E74C0F|nr:chromate efflux transporter [Rhizobium sp. TRM95796]MCV3766952.1 chromate efflux transporter [Rhizobium sp. TRM95796]